MRLIAALVIVGSFVACGSPVNVANLSAAKKHNSCTTWVYTDNPSWNKLKTELGVELSLDCKAIDEEIAYYNREQYNTFANVYANNLLNDLAAQIPEIKKLERKPTKIILGLLTGRGADTGIWNLRIESVGKRGQFFVNRERALQPLDKRLFNNEIFLTTGTDAFSQSLDNVYKDENEGVELGKSVAFLESMKDLLLKNKANIRHVVLPLGTNLARLTMDLEYNGRDKSLLLPHQIAAKNATVFVEEIVGNVASLHTQIGQVAIMNSMMDYATDMEKNDVFSNPESVYAPFVIRRLASSYARLLALAPELKAVIEKNKIYFIRLNVIEGSYGMIDRNIMHHIEKEQSLTIAAGVSDLDEISLFDVEATRKCLTVLASPGQIDYGIACQARFN